MRSVVVGTAGHIDHGKSALVLALTGTDPDRLKEEKARGITIDLGFAHYTEGDVNVAFIDVPGHERFVKNMLAGATGIDAVLLVVAADESVMPQTREHFDICRLLHVQGGLVALTKADLVDADTLELARMEVRELIAGSFLDQASIIAVSAKTGEGLPALRAALGELARSVEARAATGVVRLPIDRGFSMKGFGTVVTGTLVSGHMTLDAELELLPARRRVKVRGLQVHGRKQERAIAGQRVAVNLGGVEVGELGRGDTLATPGAFAPTLKFDGVLEMLPGARPLRHGSRVRFHQGTTELLGRVSLSAAFPLEARLAQPGSAASQHAGLVAGPSALDGGDRAFVRMRLEAPAVLTRGDRFILRAYSPPVTIAGGSVLDPDPPRVGARTAAALARFFSLDIAGDKAEGGEAGPLSLMLEERGAAGLDVDVVTSRLGASPERASQLASQLEAMGRAVLVGNVLVASSVLADLKQRLLQELARYHRAQPLSEGMPREEVKSRLFRRAHGVVVEKVIGDLAEEKKINARDRLALSTHQLSLSEEEAHARRIVEEAHRTAGFKPPDLTSLASSLGLSAAVVERMVALLIRQKVLVRVDTLVFHQETLQRLKAEMAALKSATRGPTTIDVAVFKERYGVSRKFAIPLLEFLDRERVTRRVGESRVIL